VRSLLAIQHIPVETQKTLRGGDLQDEAREAGEAPYEILRRIPEHPPQLVARASRFHERFLRLLSS